MNTKPIYVTQPSLAPLSEFTALLEGVWERGILTHNGPLVQQLESELAEKLGLKGVIAVSNGTIALQMAIRALELKGEIIVPPFTWVASISAIQWEGCTPVFCDIDPDTLNIDPALIEACITENTVAIMPVHVFGNPCDVDAIQTIADRHGLKVIYDAAHAVGTTLNGRSVLDAGHISATSLHATKLLNTAEGGACVTTDEALLRKLQRIRFFGHNDDKTDIVEVGFNGKMTEVHAALGLANMKYYDEVLAHRKGKYAKYKQLLEANDKIRFQTIRMGESNYSYFPVIFDSEAQMLKVVKALNAVNVFPRRYFYPSVNTFTKVVDYAPMPISEDISARILCLPLYTNLSAESIDGICRVVNDTVA